MCRNSNALFPIVRVTSVKMGKNWKFQSELKKKVISLEIFRPALFSCIGWILKIPLNSFRALASNGFTLFSTKYFLKRRFKTHIQFNFSMIFHMKKGATQFLQPLIRSVLINQTKKFQLRKKFHPKRPFVKLRF